MLLQHGNSDKVLHVMADRERTIEVVSSVCMHLAFVGIILGNQWGEVYGALTLSGARTL